MLQENRTSWAVLLLVSFVFLGFSLFANLPAIHKGFLIADQATYYAMAQSIAFDGDLKYTKKDLVRYYEDFNAGPNGLFLIRHKTPAGEELVYAKNLAYPLFAAPFVLVFGTNGPLVFHSVLLFLLLAMGAAYFSLANPGGRALGRVLTFLFASVAWIYALWIAPDFFNLVLVSSVLFLWLYKVRKKEYAQAGPESRPGCLDRFLASDASDYIAAVLAGIAAYAKPPNIAVLGPFLLWYLIKKKFLKAAAILLLAALGLGALFGTTVLFT